jgi:dihydroneopterin aldolase/2-amino-4-hydroxy-6-hydroxymethyldihydropteridine diphosphokinase
MPDDAPRTRWAWIALGSNLGHRGRALACLRRSLEARGLVIAAASEEVLTRPVGVLAQGDFHNQVVLARSPEAWTGERWLRVCQAAEADCGRRPTYRWGPRRADADLVLLGRSGEVASPAEPTVPHPELASRPFWSRLIAQAEAAAGQGSGAISG